MVEYAKHRGVLARKLSFGEGWPDYMFLYRGRILFIEFKQPGGRQRPLQKYVGRLLREQGFQVELIDNLIDGREAIRKWIDGPTNSVDGVA